MRASKFISGRAASLGCVSKRFMTNVETAETAMTKFDTGAA